MESERMTALERAFGASRVQNVRRSFDMAWRYGSPS
jgi:hypothetical protein